MNSIINNSRIDMPGSLDNNFYPAILANKNYLKAVKDSGKGVKLSIALERGNNCISTYNTVVFPENTGRDEENNIYTERLVKTLLWIYGGWKLTIGGPSNIGKYIRDAYSPSGIRSFDAEFMGRIYEKPFTVDITEADIIPQPRESATPAGRHLNGCRIGFDAGGSDRKVSAVIDGVPVFSEETIWHPKLQDNPQYHYDGIMASIKAAAAHMPRVDAIGVSAAGIYVNNRVMAASLFIKVPEQDFQSKVKDMFLSIQQQMGNIPLEVANDGDVTALAGAMELNDNRVLGIAMGTSEAGGYVDTNGNITGWLNELAFVPVDFNPFSAVDEWSGDYGCGVKYFSQDAIIKLAPFAGIEFDYGLSPAEKLKFVQTLLSQGHKGAADIFKTIGYYLGYSLAYYCEFYDVAHILILGRVTSGEGGSLIQKNAREILDREFPEISNRIKLHLPDESSRRVGQSIAAASLPIIS